MSSDLHYYWWLIGYHTYSYFFEGLFSLAFKILYLFSFSFIICLKRTPIWGVLGLLSHGLVFFFSILESSQLLSLQVGFLPYYLSHFLQKVTKYMVWFFSLCFMSLKLCIFSLSIVCILDNFFTSILQNTNSLFSRASCVLIKEMVEKVPHIIIYLLTLSNFLFQNVILGSDTLILTTLLLLKTFLEFFRNYLIIHVLFHFLFSGKF